MKPRYKKGDKVKLHKSIHPLDKEYIGKIFTIKCNYIGSVTGGIWYELEEIRLGFRQDQLKKFSPSRTGKYRNERGQFMSKKVVDLGIDRTCNYCHKRLCMCKERATNGDWIEDTSDSKQRNYQKIEKLERVEYVIWGDKMCNKVNEIIDRLNNL